MSVDELLKGELDTTKEAKGATLSQSELTKNSLTTEQKKERAIIALAASIGAILGILAYNFGWLG